MESHLVVVTAPLTVYVESDREVTAARFRVLGLTAYGKDREEAVSTLKRMFNKMIHAYRDRGQLEMQLTALGVEWCRAKDYPLDSPPYENTNDQPLAAATSSPLPKQATTTLANGTELYNGLVMAA